jgi:dolichyl-phosphate-mannose-protein mannosyltransferase
MQSEGRKLAGLGACGILLATFAINSWLSWRHTSTTFDEPIHLVSARVLTEQSDFRCDPQNPPFWKYYVALGSPGGSLPLDHDPPQWSGMLGDTSSQQDYVQRILYRTPGVDADALVRAGRARMLFLGVVLGALIAWWAWRLAGPVAAIVATAFYCFDPNFLAHSALIKNDAPIALEFTALMYVVWRVGRQAKILNCLVIGALAGAAIMTKFSGLMALPFLAAALLLRAMIPTDWRVLNRTARTLGSRLLAAAAISALAALVAYIFIWASYGWRYASSSNPRQNLGLDDAVQGYLACQSIQNHGGTNDTPLDQILQWSAEAQAHPDWVVNCVRWADQQHLFPRAFLRGFLVIEQYTYSRAGFLLGQISLRGWWYYLPVTLAVKTPLATLIALALALGLFWKISRPRDVWATLAVLVAPLIYAISAMHSDMDVGIRHFLPLYPFLYIGLGVVAASALARFGSRAVAVVAILLLGLAVETCCAFPNYLSFFNIATGGYRGGARILSDSNIDWGQNLPALADWQRQHPQYQLMLSYFGAADPRYYGIHYHNLPGSFAPDDEPIIPGRQPYGAISVVILQGSYLDAAGRQFYEQFRDHPPTQILGGGIYLYAPN